MNFFTYIGKTPAEFTAEYIETDLVQHAKHAEFPLDIFTYSRLCVRMQQWDAVTSKCRGIVVHRETGEIVARPFEKFHNYGSELVDESQGLLRLTVQDEPVVWEKLDGFLCTLYTWDGVDYIASKGSFHSIHAKWATAWLRKKYGNIVPMKPANSTLVFEGLHRDLRIVIDYKERQELALLAVIDNETGEELNPEALRGFAQGLEINIPDQFKLTLKQAHEFSLNENETSGEEGFVLTWYRSGQTPFRLKLKFIEYLRLHRLVTGVSPKHIWEVLSTNQTVELQEYLENSTPWFKAFVEKWTRALKNEYKRLEMSANMNYNRSQLAVEKKFPNGYRNMSELQEARKTFALEATKPECKEPSAGAFALLDNKPLAPILWKQVRAMTRNGQPMVDAHNT